MVTFETGIACEVQFGTMTGNTDTVANIPHVPAIVDFLTGDVLSELRPNDATLDETFCLSDSNFGPNFVVWKSEYFAFLDGVHPGAFPNPGIRRVTVTIPVNRAFKTTWAYNVFAGSKGVLLTLADDFNAHMFDTTNAGLGFTALYPPKNASQHEIMWERQRNSNCLLFGQFI